VLPGGEHESFEGNTRDSSISQRLHARRLDRASHASRYESVKAKTERKKKSVGLAVPREMSAGSVSGGEQSGGEFSGGEEGMTWARSKSGRRVSSKKGLSAEKTKHLWDIFQVADADQTGTICAKELMEILSDESLTGVCVCVFVYVCACLQIKETLSDKMFCCFVRM
jgi:hypothetical protein